MARNTKQRQQLKRLWRNRSLLSLGLLCLIGVAAARTPIIFEQRSRYQQTQVKLQVFKQKLERKRVLELAQACFLVLERLQGVEYSLERLRVLTQKRELPQQLAQLRYDLPEQLQQKWKPTLESARKRKPILEQNLEQTLEQALEHMQALEQPLESGALLQGQSWNWVQVLEQKLKQMLRRSRSLSGWRVEETLKSDLDLEQALERLQELEQLLVQNLELHDRKHFRELEQLLVQDLERSQVLVQAQASLLKRRMSYEFITLGAAIFGVLLLLLLLQRHRTGLPLTGHLVLVLPEECVAELAALQQRLKQQQRPVWFVRCRMVQETLALMVGVYVQINLDNWGLPGQGNSRRIDDE